MPKRLIDGDRIWTSNKIAEIEPESYRPEYANLLPLGLANGSFECNENRVWRDVYAFNRPSVCVEDVIDILDEFERVRLLFRWHDDQGKTWGFWVGIKSGGLLPPQTQQKDYKKGLEPPAELLERFLSGEIHTGLTKGRTYAATREPQGKHLANPREPQDGFGIGLPLARLGGGGKTDPPETTFEDEDTDIMNPVREIPKISENILGVEVKIYPSDATRVKELTAVHGGTRVTNDYTDWCHENVGVYSRPLLEYLKVASERLRGAISPATDKAVINIARELTYLSDNTVTFNNMNKLGLSELTKAGWTQPEIEAAWGDFFQKMDKDNPKNFEFAAKNFLEGADGLLYGNRKKKQKRKDEFLAKERAYKIMVSESEAERVARKLAREAEEALVEDVLE